MDGTGRRDDPRRARGPADPSDPTTLDVVFPGGMLMAKIVGYLLQWTGSYRIPFFIAGGAYLVALGIIHLLTPRLEPANIKP